MVSIKFRAMAISGSCHGYLAMLGRDSAGDPRLAVPRLYVGDGGVSKFFERNLIRPCASPRDSDPVGRLTQPNGRRAHRRQRIRQSGKSFAKVSPSTRAG